MVNSVNYQAGRIWNGLGGEPLATPGGDYPGKCCGKPHRNCGQWIIHGNSKLTTGQHSLLSLTGCCECNGTTCFELLLPCILQSWARIIHPFSFRLPVTDLFVCFFNHTTKKDTCPVHLRSKSSSLHNKKPCPRTYLMRGGRAAQRRHTGCSQPV